MVNLKHQLMIYLDFVPGHDVLTVTYSYPFSGDHKLPERRLHLSWSSLDRQLADDLALIAQSLTGRIGAIQSVRLPHAEVHPQIRPAVLTIVIQDQQRENSLPLARLYYSEVIPEIQSQKEREIRVEKHQFSREELEALKRIKSRAKRIAWDDYKDLIGTYLFK